MVNTTEETKLTPCEDAWQAIEKLPVKLTFVRDLIHYCGPFLSLFESENNEKYLYFLCDEFESKSKLQTYINRWLIFKVTENSFNQYMQNAMSLRQLFFSISEPIFVMDFEIENYKVNKPSKEGDRKIGNIWVTSKANIPLDILPGADSYWNSPTNSGELGEELILTL